VADTLTTIQDVQALVCEPHGEKITSERAALDLIGEVMQQGIEWVLIPVKPASMHSIPLNRNEVSRVCLPCSE
jgi:hypothetical protein